MPLSTFFFRASLPARRESLEPLAPLIRQVLAYAGYPAEESREIAAQIEKVASHGLASTGKGHVTVTFERDANRFRVSLSAPHLSGAAPAKGLMDAVTVDRGASGPTLPLRARVSLRPCSPADVMRLYNTPDSSGRAFRPGERRNRADVHAAA